MNVVRMDILTKCAVRSADSAAIEHVRSDGPIAINSSSNGSTTDRSKTGQMMGTKDSALTGGKNGSTKVTPLGLAESENLINWSHWTDR